jgi:hypothetical protein
MHPQFIIASRVADKPKEWMPEGSTVRMCIVCRDDVWISPSSRAVERKMQVQLPAICQPCYRPKAGDMGIITRASYREQAEVAARRRR